MKPNHKETRELVKCLNTVNIKMLTNKVISEDEYERNVLILYNAITGRLNLSEKQINLINIILKQRLCFKKISICMSLLEMNFN